MTNRIEKVKNAFSEVFIGIRGMIKQGLNDEEREDLMRILANTIVLADMDRASLDRKSVINEDDGRENG